MKSAVCVLLSRRFANEQGVATESRQSSVSTACVRRSAPAGAAAPRRRGRRRRRTVPRRFSLSGWKDAYVLLSSRHTPRRCRSAVAAAPLSHTCRGSHTRTDCRALQPECARCSVSHHTTRCGDDHRHLPRSARHTRISHFPGLFYLFFTSHCAAPTERVCRGFSLGRARQVCESIKMSSVRNTYTVSVVACLLNSF